MIILPIIENKYVILYRENQTWYWVSQSLYFSGIFGLTMPDLGLRMVCLESGNFDVVEMLQNPGNSGKSQR